MNRDERPVRAPLRFAYWWTVAFLAWSLLLLASSVAASDWPDALGHLFFAGLQGAIFVAIRRMRRFEAEAARREGRS